MARRATVVALGAVLLVASGCRHPWFSRCGSGSGSGSAAACRGTGSASASDSCFDPCYGTPAGGTTVLPPGGLVPGGSGGMIPGGTGGPSNELPPPGGLIPPTSVPSAPTSPAPPGNLGGGEATRFGIPTRNK